MYKKNWIALELANFFQMIFNIITMWATLLALSFVYLVFLFYLICAVYFYAQTWTVHFMYQN